MSNNPEFPTPPPDNPNPDPDSPPLKPLANELAKQLSELPYAKKNLPPAIISALLKLGIKPSIIGSKPKKSPKPPPKT